MVPGSVRIGTLEGAAFVAACLYALFLAAYVAVDTRGLRQLTSRVLRARAVGWVPLLLLLAVLACDVVEAMEDLDRLGPRLVFRDFFRLVTGLAGDAFAVVARVVWLVQ